MVMKRGQSINMFIKKQPVPETDEDRFWNNLSNRINNGQVIPIISNGMIYDLVFSKALGDEPAPAPDSAGAGAGASGDGASKDASASGDAPASADADSGAGDEEVVLKMNVPNILSMAWASENSYPFTESHDLARVAKYVRSKSRSAMDTKEDYITFLKNALLTYASQVGVDPDRISELSEAINENSFTDLAVKELHLLEFGPGCDDPLSILAGLPLPIYITTSYHDILERALQAMGKEPITQVCFWSGPVTPLADEHKPLQTLEPSATTPLVYHLFGLENYPLTMVLSEDDYLDFLVNVTIDRGTSRAILPAYLQSAISVSWLMLLGYRLLDWDFRTLFRSLDLSGEKKNAAFLNTIIQLSLSDQYQLPDIKTGQQSLNQAQKYLQDYFNPLSFEIRWSNPSGFLTILQQEWRNRKQK